MILVVTAAEKGDIQICFFSCCCLVFVRGCVRVLFKLWEFLYVMLAQFVKWCCFPLGVANVWRYCLVLSYILFVLSVLFTHWHMCHVSCQDHVWWHVYWSTMFFGQTCRVSSGKSTGEEIFRHRKFKTTSPLKAMELKPTILSPFGDTGI